MSSPTPEVRRQVVTWTMYRLDPAFRRQPPHVKRDAAAEFVKALDDRGEETIQLTYSCAGLKRDADLVVWRIAFDVDDLQRQDRAVNKTVLGGYLGVTHRLLAMTKRSQYVDPVDPFHDENSRARIVPGRRKFLFVYPFVKTRPWYLKSPDERQAMMGEHIRVGNEYPSREAQHDVQFRPRRPGFRRGIRDRRDGGLPRPRAAAARDGGQLVHAARHADVHLRPPRRRRESWTNCSNQIGRRVGFSPPSFR